MKKLVSSNCQNNPNELLVNLCLPIRGGGSRYSSESLDSLETSFFDPTVAKGAALLRSNIAGILMILVPRVVGPLKEADVLDLETSTSTSSSESESSDSNAILLFFLVLSFLTPSTAGVLLTEEGGESSGEGRSIPLEKAGREVGRET